MSIRASLLALAAAIVLAAAALAPATGAATPGGFMSHTHPKPDSRPKEPRRPPR